MSALTISLILVALGSAGFALPNHRAALFSGAVQWLGLGIATQATPSGAFQWTRAGAVEIVTAVVCVAVLVITLRSVDRANPARARRGAVREYLPPALAVILGGLAGYLLASIVPLTGQAEIDLAFYWAALSGVILLSTQATRDAVKLALGLFSLLNATVLLVLVLGVNPPGTGLLALMALCRVGMSLLLAYGWTWLASIYGHLTLEPIFGKPAQPTSLELATVPPPAGEDIRSLVPAAPEVEEDEDVQNEEGVQEEQEAGKR